MEQVGREFCVTSCEQVLEQPVALSVTVSVYVPGPWTMMHWDVSFVLHW